MFRFRLSICHFLFILCFLFMFPFFCPLWVICKFFYLHFNLSMMSLATYIYFVQLFQQLFQGLQNTHLTFTVYLESVFYYFNRNIETLFPYRFFCAIVIYSHIENSISVIFVILIILYILKNLKREQSDMLFIYKF